MSKSSGTLDLFQNSRFADAVVVIRRAATPRSSQQDDSGGEHGTPQGDQGAEEGLEELKRFPGHMAVLCQSEYFDAQVKFLISTNSLSGGKPVLTFTVDDASHVPAVEAVLAAMYNSAQRLQDLQQTLLVHALQFTDVMMVQHIALQAVSILLAKITADGMAAETLAAISGCGSAWLSSLIGQPEFDSKIEPVLVSGVGNLEELWADSKLRGQLLRLPLPAIWLLLSSSKLQVYTEDTVLYTAANYVVSLPQEQQEEASKQLAVLVRAQHLSMFQLTAQVVNTDTSTYNIQPTKHDSK